MNKEQFINELSKININLSETQLKELDTYCAFLQEKNKVVNLTAIKEENEIYLKHFYDSMTIVKAIDLNNFHNLLDIGTGAGFPGMIIKILYPNLKVTLLDSNNKKIEFLKELAEKLQIKEIEFIHERSEIYYQKVGSNFDVVVARAVANLTTLSEICLPLVKKNGYFISMKGQMTEELEESEYAIKLLGGVVEDVIEFNLPIEESKRTLIKINKIKETPKEYPRRYEKILKNPLKKK